MLTFNYEEKKSIFVKASKTEESIFISISKKGYIITAYLTDRIKEGKQIYVKN